MSINALSRKFLLCHKFHDFKKSFYIAFGLNKTAEKRRNKQFVQNKCRSKRLFGFLKSENLRTVRSHFLCFWRLSHNFKSREIDITPMFAMSINRQDFYCKFCVSFNNPSNRAINALAAHAYFESVSRNWSYNIFEMPNFRNVNRQLSYEDF